MKHLPLIVIGIAALLFIGSKYVPNLVKPDGPDMVTAFEGGSADAAQFGALCQSLHDCLQSDWEQEGYIKTGTQVDNLRVIARKIRTKNKSYQDKYPKLKGILEEHFRKHVGTSGGPLDEKAKESWLKAYQELADSCKYASKQL